MKYIKPREPESPALAEDHCQHYQTLHEHQVVQYIDKHILTRILCEELLNYVFVRFHLLNLLIQKYYGLEQTANKFVRTGDLVC